MDINKFQDHIADAFEHNNIEELVKLKAQSYKAIKSSKGEKQTFYVEAFKLLSASLLANEMGLHENHFKDRINEVNNQILSTVEKAVTAANFLKHKSLKNLDLDIASRLKSADAWTEISIRGDSNCGFTATNTTRKEVVKYLLKNSDNKRVRSLVAPEIKGWLLLKEYKNNNLPQNLVDKLDVAVENTLNETSMAKEVFEAYVRHYYGGENSGYLVMPDYDGDSRTTSVMDVIAEMKGTPIRIWKKVKNKPAEVYLHSIVGEVTKENMDKTVDLIHSGAVKHEGGNHFNKLKGKPRVARLGSTEMLAGA